MSVQPPSGEQFEIGAGGYRAVVTGVGAGLRYLEHDGRPLVDGFAEDEIATGGRGQLLLPWPNRIDGGRYDFDGAEHQLPITEVAAGNAIHGLTRWSVWSPVEHRKHSVTLAYRLAPQPGYPFALAFTAAYSVVEETGLVVQLEAHNVGAKAAPYGCGAHPYLTVSAHLNVCELTLPAGVRLDVDERGLPTTSRSVEAAGVDFRVGSIIGDTAFDHPFTELEREGNGRCRVVLRDPATDLRTTLWCDEAFAWLQVYSADTAGDRPRAALAVEPMTCPPNAFVTGRDLVVLQPGERHVANWGICR